VLGLVVGSYVPGLQRDAARPRAGGGEGEGEGEVAADGGAPAARPRATHPACPYSVLFVYCETHIVVFLFIDIVNGLSYSSQ
jgi:hypothetical protein